MQSNREAIVEARPLPSVVILTLDYRAPDGTSYSSHCRDWQHYQELPDALTLKEGGETVVRTGWNSDKCRAYYRPESELPCHVATIKR